MSAASIGFIGIGTMGLPMARRLLAAGMPLTVWNRTAAKCASLLEHGAAMAPSIDALCQQSSVILLMLLDQDAVDAALGRGSPAFARRVRGRTLVMLGTTSPAYSAALDEDIRASGGHYVEAPVSGSRVPAEDGTLVAMVAGDPDDIVRVQSLLAPMCRDVVRCGAVPAASAMKLAVNHYLIVLVAALAEAVATAHAGGVDLQAFGKVLDAGPMASAVSRLKMHKLLAGDFAPQAAIGDVARIARLVREQARSAQVHAPLIDTTVRLFDAACARGLSQLDMAAVLQPAPAHALDLA